MTREEIIKLAAEAGFRLFNGRIIAADNSISGYATESLERFAALVAAHERERIVAICDRLDKEADMSASPDYFAGINAVRWALE